MIVMVKIHEPNFFIHDFINDNPIADMATAITGKILG